MAGDTKFGIDVSANQGKIDWVRVGQTGLTFAVARCVGENGKIDPTYARNVAGARDAGMIPGAYIFLAGGGVAATHAARFIKTVGDPTGMLVMLDVEKPNFHSTPSVADIRVFVAAWRQAHPTHPLLVYGSSRVVLAKLAKTADPQLAKIGPLWMSFYPNERKGPTLLGCYASVGGNDSAKWKITFGGWNGPTIWQFTSSRVHIHGIPPSKKHPGVPGNVDTNAFRGTRADLMKLTGVADAGPLTPHAAGTPVADAGKQFHIVVPGDTLSGIAAQHGFPSFQALIAAFPENAQFAAHPGVIHPGDRVRIA
jgi:GH25 family lysozyme M1 (1,4-beta-N-acetylmuramidase)